MRVSGGKRMKNNNWIPVSSGLLPDDMEDVQVTFIMI